MPSAGVRRLALMAALAGSTLREAFQVLISMTFILGFLPLLYLFVAWPIVRRLGGGDAGGALACRCVATIGFAFTSLALVLALIPAPDNEHPVLFLVKVLLGSAALVGVGIGQFVYSRKSAAP